jgi:hypothetical protein
MSLIYDLHFEALQKRLNIIQVTRGKGGTTLPISEIQLAIAWRARRQLPLHDPTVSMTDYWRRFFPRIEAEVKYRELRYTFALSPPKGTRAQRRTAFIEESARRKRHIEGNPILYTYIRMDRHDKDAALFGRDPAIAKANSEWLAGLWAFDRYQTWLSVRYPWLLPSPTHEE